MAEQALHPAFVPTRKRCRYCEAGETLRGNEHWIVKSIVPARIDIRKCVAIAKAEAAQ